MKITNIQITDIVKIAEEKEIVVKQDITIDLPLSSIGALSVSIYSDELLTQEIPGIITDIVKQTESVKVSLDNAKVEKVVYIVVITDKHKIVSEVIS